MRIGFIGAGKVGFSMGKYFAEHHIDVSGYYSQSTNSAKEAADFTKSKYYETTGELVRDSEVIFITVPDDAIGQVWEQLKTLQPEIKDKIICHCSGVLSSKIFSDISAYNCSGLSIHPLLAVSSKSQSYKEISSTLFTIEGEEKAAIKFKELLNSCGNEVIFIEPQEKVRYHAAAVMASNLVIGLVETAVQELIKCGFTKELAMKAIIPFMQKNVAHLGEHTLEEALTGPVERGDVGTVKAHLDKLDGNNKEIYRLLSLKALEIAKVKNPQRDYDGIETELE